MRLADTALSLSHPRTTKRRGFNLVEAAIVLGVVGLVIGGIWVAASAVNSNFALSGTQTDIVSIISNVQKTFTRQDIYAYPSLTDITATGINAGVFPSSWIKNGVATNAWGGGVTLRMGQSLISGGHFSLSLLYVPQDVCIKLVTRISSLQGPASYQEGIGLGSLQIKNIADTTNRLTPIDLFPVSVSRAEAACIGNDNRIIFNFVATRPN